MDQMIVSFSGMTWKKRNWFSLNVKKRWLGNGSDRLWIARIKYIVIAKLY